MTERASRSRRRTSWADLGLEVVKWTTIGILGYSLMWALLWVIDLAARIH